MVGSAAEPSRPVAWLIAARALRDFGDGFVAVLLPVYLLSLGFSALQVGVLATLSLAGSALLTLAFGVLGGRHDPLGLLRVCAALMIATGMAFTAVHDYGVLLAVAFVGTINPSAGGVSVFVPLEHAALTREVVASRRTWMFAHYSLIGALAAALGAFAAAGPELLGSFGVERRAALRAMFGLYAMLGLGAAICYARVPPRPRPKPDAPASTLGPSRRIVVRLALLFCLDSFAGGLVVQSLLALWLFERFGLSLVEAGAFFFWSGLLSAASFPVAARLANRFGLIPTMVFTHIPASLMLIAAAFATDVRVALGLLLARAFLSQMDVPTRSSYVMAVVSEPERAAAASFTAVPRSLAAAASPALSGALFAASLHTWPLLLCGALKIAYDLLLLRQFRHVRPPEER
ncbi:MAG: MFS transporter [Xanthomonadales bacterium]|nr:MFS transporter [Xanthomonadales bacterium]